MTCVYAGRSAVQIFAEAIELSLPQKHPGQLQCQASLQPKENHSFFSGSKVASADSVATHIHIETSLKISGAIPPLNLSPSMTHIGTLFYLYLLPMNTLFNKNQVA
jgi:hypothetical protein